MKKLLFFPLVLLIGTTSFSQKSSLLWEISGNGLKKSSYLYGTMHLRDARIFQFGDSVKYAFSMCEAVAGELVMDEANPMALMKVIMMPKDTTLSMLLSEKDYSLVKEKAEEKLGFMAAAIDNIKPFFTSALLTEGEFESDSGKFLDQYFQDLGKASEKEIIGIETMEEQIAAVDKVSLKAQAEMLLSSLKEDTTSEKQTAEMLEIYLSQDLQKLDKFMGEVEMSPEMMESVLTHRNKIMAERIDTIIRKRSTFVALGAAHLGGNDGILARLQRSGFSVRPVYSPFHISPAKVEILKDENGWYIFDAEAYQVSFPQAFKKTNNENTIFMMAVDPVSGSLYTASESQLDQNSKKFFSQKLKEYKESGEKVIESKKYTLNGVPALEVQVEKGAYVIKTVYCYLDKQFAELSVTGKREEINSKTTQQFFNSFHKK